VEIFSTNGDLETMCSTHNAIKNQSGPGHGTLDKQTTVKSDLARLHPLPYVLFSDSKGCVEMISLLFNGKCSLDFLISA